MNRPPKLVPFLFSTPMVKAIQDGTKTQTRRLVKPEPELLPAQGQFPIPISEFQKSTGELLKKGFSVVKSYNDLGYAFPKPKAEVGDVIWARESFYAYGHWLKEDDGKLRFIDITTDEVLGTTEGYLYHDNAPLVGFTGKDLDAIGYHKRPSIHMPFKAARFFLLVEEVRAERLDDISDEDAIAEGIARVQNGNLTIYEDYFFDPGEWFSLPKNSFRSLWASINGEEDLYKNPFVWVYRFKKISREEALRLMPKNA